MAKQVRKESKDLILRLPGNVRVDLSKELSESQIKLVEKYAPNHLEDVEQSSKKTRRKPSSKGDS